MSLSKHTRTKLGSFRRERLDSRAENLRKDYPEFYKVRSDATLGGVKKKMDLPKDSSIEEVRRALRKKV